VTHSDPQLAKAIGALLEAPRKWVFRASGATVAHDPARRLQPFAEEGTNGGSASAHLAGALGLPSALCRLLVLRGFADSTAAKRFLKPQLTDLYDPHALADMDRAVQRLVRAVRTGERILVHGDYDVDGICAAVLLTRVLRRFGATVEPFVPHRMTDGYDLGYAGVRHAVGLGVGVIVTADCGVVAHDAVQQATAAGIDVIVTDHHTPGATLPAALAIINPNRADCPYPEKGLCGAGVAFKLCEALVSALGGERDALLWELDLVGLATIADLAPLRGENRVLAYYGLRVLRQTRNAGLRALLRVANINVEHPIGGMQVSHLLAPRINAVGRMGAASRGVRLLLCDDDAVAEALATEMDAENRTRQEVDRRILTEALGMLETEFDPAQHYAIVLSSPDWHPGVIGIVASRVVERVHRPVVLIAEDLERGRGRGSARSIPPFHLYDGVHACGSLLDRYGGHRQAAGLELRLERLADFRRALNEHARAVLTPDDLVPELRIDLEIRLGEADAALHRFLRHFGPFGMGHPQPVFVARNVGIAGYPREAGGGQHLKLVLSDDGAKLPAIGFRMAERARSIDFTRTRIDIAFHLHEDRWNGRSQLQARLVGLRPAS
jgi:single-stranded-DNA-specific exonuclease